MGNSPHKRPSRNNVCLTNSVIGRQIRIPQRKRLVTPVMLWKCGFQDVIVVCYCRRPLYCFPTSSPDVGGGSVLNDTPHSLENITLQWMVRQVMASGCGIRFDDAALARNYILPMLPPADPSTSEEPDVDAADAVQPLSDELVKNPLWWILEILPLTFVWQDAIGVWHKTIRFVQYL